MTGASAEEVMGRVRHLPGGNRRYQTWIIVGKPIKNDGGQG